MKDHKVSENGDKLGEILHEALNIINQKDNVKITRENQFNTIKTPQIQRIA